MIREIDPASARAARGSARLVDVREAEELRGELGFIEGSEHVPLAAVEARARTWDKDEPVILICRSGNRSTRAGQALVAAGFRRVFNMTGGMLAYQAASLPATR